MLVCFALTFFKTVKNILNKLAKHVQSLIKYSIFVLSSLTDKKKCVLFSAKPTFFRQLRAFLYARHSGKGKTNLFNSLHCVNEDCSLTSRTLTVERNL